MANQKITQLAPAIAFTGSELMELVQAGVNVKASLDFIHKYSIAKYELFAPGGPGVYPDIALPGDYDYIFDVDTTAGQITLDSFISQRDRQRVTLCCIGSGGALLVIGGAAGTAANRIRQSAPTNLSQQDSITIQYVADVSRWIVA